MRIQVWFVLPLLTLCSAAGAEPESAPDSLPPSGVESVEDLVRAALRDNPDLAAVRAGAEAAAARPPQLRALPDPRFTVGWMGEHVETARGPQSLIYSLSQEIPFPGKRGLMGQVAARQAEITGEQARAMEFALAAEVRRLAAELIYLDEAIAIQRDEEGLLDEIGKIASTRYATGTTQLQEVARIEVERAENDEELLSLLRERDAMAAEMNRLLGRGPEVPLPDLALPTAPESTAAADTATADTLAAMGELRPELQAAEKAIAKSDAAARLARRSYLPDFMLGFEYLVVDQGMSPSPEAGTDAWMIEFGVNLPIWLGKQRAGVREAKHLQAESRAARAAEENRIRSEIAIAEAQVRRLRETVDLHRQKLLPQTELALSSARASYRAGGIGFPDLIETERSLIRARLAAARARADLARSAADLARATAQPLPQPSGETP
jgi:outer membrane protein TolC